jgi:hypothetical protein
MSQRGEGSSATMYSAGAITRPAACAALDVQRDGVTVQKGHARFSFE